jgi:Outer membrane protein beta-barrel domain
VRGRIPLQWGMTARPVFLLLATFLGCTAPVAAQEAADPAYTRDFVPHFEITPFAGYRVGGTFDYDGLTATQSLDIRDDSSWGVDVGLYRDNASFYEVLYSQQASSLDTRGTTLGRLQLRTEYAHFGGTLLFPEANWFVPYLSMTIGATKFDPEGDQYRSETDFSMSLGGGLRLPFNEHAAVVLGVRGYLTFVDANTQIFCVSNGGGACLFRISSNSFFQAEAQLGFALTF